MNPLLAFVFGVVNAEILTLGLWWPTQKNRTLRMYFEGATSHLIVLVSLASMFMALWHPSIGGLDMIMKLLPDSLLGDWWNGVVPYNPQVGVIAGFLLNLQVGKIASAVSSRWPLDRLDPKP